MSIVTDSVHYNIKSEFLLFELSTRIAHISLEVCDGMKFNDIQLKIVSLVT